jgi:hypothetical protein
MKKIYDYTRDRYVIIDYPASFGDREPLDPEVYDTLMYTINRLKIETGINITLNTDPVPIVEEKPRTFIKRSPKF